MLDLADALKTNDTLVTLNLNNCNITRNAGKALKAALQENKKLINQDIEKNPNIEIEDVREIQRCLDENYVAYRAERKREWQERKCLIEEKDGITKMLQARDDELKKIEEIRKEAEETQLKREEIFLANQADNEEKRRRLEKKYQQEMETRATKKKKRGGMKK